MERKVSIETCIYCGEKFKIIEITYPSNLDDKRDVTIDCPYCQKTLRKKRLMGNEDVLTEKL